MKTENTDSMCIAIKEGTGQFERLNDHVMGHGDLDKDVHVPVKKNADKVMKGLKRKYDKGPGDGGGDGGDGGGAGGGCGGGEPGMAGPKFFVLFRTLKTKTSNRE